MGALLSSREELNLQVIAPPSFAIILPVLTSPGRLEVRSNS
jgi:hypothetical protein